MLVVGQSLDAMVVQRHDQRGQQEGKDNRCERQPMSQRPSFVATTPQPCECLQS
ncbi:MAG: hypothetical protein HW416_3415 [Chloroflexi bacterium]|nr:hypothetical protein [Chloroflexota bacterium]